MVHSEVIVAAVQGVCFVYCPYLTLFLHLARMNYVTMNVEEGCQRSTYFHSSRGWNNSCCAILSITFQRFFSPAAEGDQILCMHREGKSVHQGDCARHSGAQSCLCFCSTATTTTSIQECGGEIVTELAGADYCLVAEGYKITSMRGLNRQVVCSILWPADCMARFNQTEANEYSKEDEKSKKKHKKHKKKQKKHKKVKKRLVCWVAEKEFAR